MQQPTNKITQFWNELKRRKVFRVIAMYAATAFIIMEAGEIMLPRLGLPDWTVTFIIVLIIIGFPITVILSWIFDITPEGVKKTESIETVKEQEPLLEPVKRKLRVSDLIILALVVVVVILAYPKIFKRDKFIDIRDSEGRISVAVMPFQNLSGDTLYDGFELGLQDLLINKLSNSDELSVRHTQTMYDFFGNTDQLNYASITPSLAGDIAQKLDANTVIYGSLNTSGNKLRIIANLMDSKSKEIYKSHLIDCDSKDNIFPVVDSLSFLIKNYLEIQIIEQDADEDTRLFSKTESAEAYRYFSRGLNKFWINDHESASELFKIALEIDSDFLWAKIFLLVINGNVGRYIQAKQIVDSLYQQIDDYEYVDQLYIKYFNSLYEKNASAGINFLKKITNEIPHSRGWWYEVGRYYSSQLNQYNNAIEALEKSLEIDQKWGGEWKWIALYSVLGSAYHETGQHAKEQEIYELGLSISPDHPNIIFRQAVCAISHGDTINGNKYLETYRRVVESEGWNQVDIDYNIGRIFEEAEQYHKAITIYRDGFEKYPQTHKIKVQLGYILINKEINIDEGVELIEEALRNEPDNYNFIQIKGWGLYQQGHYEEALQLLNTAWDLRPYYNHQHFLHIQEVEQALANQNK